MQGGKLWVTLVVLACCLAARPVQAQGKVVNSVSVLSNNVRMDVLCRTHQQCWGTCRYWGHLYHPDHETEAVDMDGRGLVHATSYLSNKAHQQRSEAAQFRMKLCASTPCHTCCQISRHVAADVRHSSDAVPMGHPIPAVRCAAGTAQRRQFQLRRRDAVLRRHPGLPLVGEPSTIVGALLTVAGVFAAHWDLHPTALLHHLLLQQMGALLFCYSTVTVDHCSCRHNNLG
jgi:hypothetical protein